MSRSEAAVPLDRTGRPTRAARRLTVFRPPEPAATARQLTDEVANWPLMPVHVLARGEVARAHAPLHGVVAPQQLRLCRLLRDTAHWLTPVGHWNRTCPPPTSPGTPPPPPPGTARCARPARESRQWSRELSAEAVGRWAVRVPRRLHEQIAELPAADRPG
ncbi:hypothetical protein [Streptomyces pactum]|uniref:Uncharacterized protein n=1 Tax=Streptomyces pactum TaxID=68249 RepID=A0A1S6J291_9ACTN|nr:hypothetical protein [Streptomyces pactum]AQS65874.1 hypothetical protein B1H29_02025 [Streptomyces pactum]